MVHFSRPWRSPTPPLCSAAGCIAALLIPARPSRYGSPSVGISDRHMSAAPAAQRMGPGLLRGGWLGRNSRVPHHPAAARRRRRARSCLVADGPRSFGQLLSCSALPLILHPPSPLVCSPTNAPPPPAPSRGPLGRRGVDLVEEARVQQPRRNLAVGAVRLDVLSKLHQLRTKHKRVVGYMGQHRGGRRVCGPSGVAAPASACPAR